MELIKVADTRPLKTIELPSYPGTQVEIYQELNVGAIRSLNHIADPFDKGVRMLIMAIKDWNLGEDDGNGGVRKQEITLENIDKLPQKDLMLMLATSQNTTVEELEKKGRDIQKKTMADGSAQ